MKSVLFYDSKLKSVKTVLFRSFRETGDLTDFYCLMSICGRAYLSTLIDEISHVPFLTRFYVSQSLYCVFRYVLPHKRDRGMLQGFLVSVAYWTPCLGCFCG